MGNLQIPYRLENLEDGSSVAIVDMSGSIDGSTVKKFESDMMALAQRGVKYLLLNFAKIGYMNSTGLGILVKVLDKYQEGDGDMKLVQVPKKVRELFDMLGISSILQIYSNEESALATLPYKLVTLEPKQVPKAESMVFMAGEGEGWVISAEPEETAVDISTVCEPIGEEMYPATSIEIEPNFQGTEISPPQGGLEIFSDESIDIPEIKAELVEPETVPPAQAPPVADVVEMGIPIESAPEAIEITSAESLETKPTEISVAVDIDAEILKSPVEGRELFSVSNEILPPCAGLAVSTGGMQINADEPDTNRAQPGSSSVTPSSSPFAEVEKSLVSDQNIEEMEEISELDETMEEIDEQDDFDDELEASEHDISSLNLEDIIEKPSSLDKAGSKENEDFAKFSEMYGLSNNVDSDKIKSTEAFVDISLEASEAPENNAQETSKVGSSDMEKVIAGAEATSTEKQSSDEYGQKNATAGGGGSDVVDAKEVDLGAKDASAELKKFTVDADARSEVFKEEDAKKQVPEKADIDESSELVSTSSLDPMPPPAPPMHASMGSPVPGSMPPPAPMAPAPAPMAPAPAPMAPAPAPMAPSPAPSFAPAAKPEKAPPIKRKTTVRYYEQMNPHNSYPLVVAFSKEEIKKIQLDQVKQISGQKTLQVKKEEPEVMVTPCLSGCLVTPSSITVDVTPDNVSAEFWVTPVVQGNILGWIDISYQGKSVEKISLQTKSVKQTIAKVSAFIASLSPIVSFILDGFDLNLQQQALKGIPKLLAILDKQVGLLMAGGICMGLFALTGFLFYLRNRPKQADILEQFLDVKP